jgi:hypothetical protein
MNKIQAPSEKSFAITFSALFFVISGYYLVQNKVYYGFLCFNLSFVLLMVGFMAPKILYYPNLAWFKLGMLLSKVVNPVVLTLLYLCCFAPVGIIRRLLKKNQRFYGTQKGLQSNWTTIQQNPWQADRLKQQF